MVGRGIREMKEKKEKRKESKKRRKREGNEMQLKSPFNRWLVENTGGDYYISIEWFIEKVLPDLHGRSSRR